MPKQKDYTPKGEARANREKGAKAEARKKRKRRDEADEEE
jgi:hypothetical protein